MNRSPRHILGGLLAAAVSLTCLSSPVVAATAAAVGDLLERPAQHSVRATTAVTLAIASAGPRLVAVGESGTVLLSDDDGRSWRQAMTVPASVALTGVYFVSATLGWAIGHAGVVLNTDDGGETWSRQLDGRQIGALAIDEARAMPAGSDEAARLMRDAELLVRDGPDKPLLGLYFANEKQGWVVGAYGLALETEDGGLTWRAAMRRIPNSGARHLYSVVPTADGLLIAGEQGRLFASTDGGQHFSRLESHYPGTWFGAMALGKDRLLAFGLRGNAWVHAPDASWRQLELGQAATLTAGLRLDDGRFVLVDEGGRLYRGTTEGVRAAGAAPVAGVSGLVRAADGALVLASLRGPYRLDLDATAGGVQ
ncbi:YCF48-related protein [Zoogloeaceae bacterium G21618-S1]|nr:YCF48-related protein [Zoogloeaceae bacterium G21618-S1]